MPVSRLRIIAESVLSGESVILVSEDGSVGNVNQRSRVLSRRPFLTVTARTAKSSPLAVLETVMPLFSNSPLLNW